MAGWMKRIHPALDTLLYGVSIYALPAVIALVSLLALVAWDNKYPLAASTPLELKILEQTGDVLSTTQAITGLERETATGYRDTRLSEKPFWLRFVVQPDARNAGSEDLQLVELPSRHATTLVCWNAATQQLLGRADRTSAEGRLRAAKAGFVVDLGRVRAMTPVLCRAEFIGPARISAVQWEASRFESSALEFHRKSGLLDGGLVVLAIFVLMTAIINREPIYLLFAAWLVFNLRMGAISAGWDTQWLGYVVPAAWLPFSRLFTVAAYYTLIIMLFRRTFRDDFERVGYMPLLRVLQWSCIPLFMLALFVPYAKALPVFWVASTATIAVLSFFLVRIVVMVRSTVAIWYGASLAVTMAATLYEVIAAALGIKDLIGSINSVTAALSSSLMAAFAIAEQIRLERRQRIKAEEELRGAYEVIPIGLFTLDERGTLISANPALRQMLNIENDVADSSRWSDYFEDGAWSRFQRLLASSGSGEVEFDGSQRPDAAEQKRFLVKAALSGERIEGSLQDITEKSKALDRLHFLAENDPLTGVLNRRGIERRLENALAAVEQGRPLAVAYLDLDRFKLVNDLYGHGVGDEVLRQVCARVTEMLTPGQEVGRIGGDEFVILFQGTPIRPAAWTCRGILERLEAQPYLVGEKAFQIGGSIGLVEAEPGALVKDVIAAADQGCREAKRSYDDSLVVYERSASVFRAREEDLRLIERIGGEGGPYGLFLEMQPLLSARDPFMALDFEVLLRMRDSDGSLIEAGRIIPLAEDKGCIGIIDRWVLGTTLAWLNQNGERLKHTRFVCMNLSGASLNDEHFVQDALAMMARYPQSARRMCIEITESVALHDLANMRRFIDTVRRAGAKVALDDFGAGYTSFSYLKDLPADVLKIDGAFIRGVNTHPANLAIVEAIVSLARSLGMKTIGEWAEDRATVQTLIEVGIDFIQGYAVARPQSPEQILAAQSAGGFIQDERLRQYVHSLSNNVVAAPLWEEHIPVKPGDLH